MRRLFLDDERMPGDVTWIEIHYGKYDIVRTQQEFQDYLLQHGIPEVISFDNDLGIGCGEGRSCVRWMTEQVMDGVLTFPENFAYTVHSKNNVAAEWIVQYLDDFIEKVINDRPS